MSLSCGAMIRDVVCDCVISRAHSHAFKEALSVDKVMHWGSSEWVFRYMCFYYW